MRWEKCFTVKKRERKLGGKKDEENEWDVIADGDVVCLLCGLVLPQASSRQWEHRHRR